MPTTASAPTGSVQRAGSGSASSRRATASTAPIFGHGGQEGAPWWSRRLGRVGHPEVGRHGAGLEQQAREHQDHPGGERRPAGGAPARGPGRSAYAVLPASAVEQRGAEHQQDPEQRPEEVGLDRGLGRAGRSDQADHPVEREAGQQEGHHQHARSVARPSSSAPTPASSSRTPARSRAGGPRPRRRRAAAPAAATRPPRAARRPVAASTATVPEKAVGGRPAQGDGGRRHRGDRGPGRQRAHPALAAPRGQGPGEQAPRSPRGAGAPRAAGRGCRRARLSSVTGHERDDAGRGGLHEVEQRRGAAPRSSTDRASSPAAGTHSWARTSAKPAVSGPAGPVSTRCRARSSTAAISRIPTRRPPPRARWPGSRRRPGARRRTRTGPAGPASRGPRPGRGAPRSAGPTPASPPYGVQVVVAARRCQTPPASRNSAVVSRPWLTICVTAPETAMPRAASVAAASRRRAARRRRRRARRSPCG